MTNPRPIQPQFIELTSGQTPFQAALRLRGLPKMLLLESALQRPELGRYSFLMADPIEWFQPDANNITATFDWLDSTLAKFRVDLIADLPPFQGGVAGLFGYEFGGAIESIRTNTNGKEPVALGVYDVVIAWDHDQERCWLISIDLNAQQLSGETQPVSDTTTQRTQQFLDLLETENSQRKEQTTQPSQTVGHTTGPMAESTTGNRPHSKFPELTSNFDRDTYLSTIEQALEYIRAGDVFQVNIAQQLEHPATGDSLHLYRQLSQCNPATFAAYFDLGDRQVISASPERLASVLEGTIETRPIKGTRRRTRHPEVDIDVAQQLLASEKDRAENVMIVDLMRNDLSRVCTDDSVVVSQFVKLESYASVLHLVSAVKGELKNETKPSDLLRAIFPGGSITGAPKVRAMEIIAELEPNTRGPYCGSLGYFGFNGNTDLNILIRTITAEQGKWKIPVGGGIVADSDPVAEYNETWTKAAGMLQAVALISSDTGLPPEPPESPELITCDSSAAEVIERDRVNCERGQP